LLRIFLFSFFLCFFSSFVSFLFLPTLSIHFCSPPCCLHKHVKGVNSGRKMEEWCRREGGRKSKDEKKSEKINNKRKFKIWTCHTKLTKRASSSVLTRLIFHLLKTDWITSSLKDWFATFSFNFLFFYL